MKDVNEAAHKMEKPEYFRLFAPRVGLEPTSRCNRDNSRMLEMQITIDDPEEYGFAFPFFDLTFHLLSFSFRREGFRKSQSPWSIA